MNPTSETPVGSITGDQDLVNDFRHPISSGNAIRDINPVNTFIMLVCLAVLSVALPGFVWPIVICLAYVGISFAAGVGRKFVSTYGKLFVVVGVILFVLRAIFIDKGHVLASLGPIVISTGGILQGLHFSLIVMALCGAVTLFFALTPIKNLMLALETRGVTPRATYVILASFQSIIDLGKNSKTVRDAQRSRGIETEGSIVTRVKAFVPILAPVFLAAMNQTDERALALDARAFNSRAKHTQLTRLKPVSGVESALTWLAVVVAIFAIVGAVFLWH